MTDIVSPEPDLERGRALLAAFERIAAEDTEPVDADYHYDLRRAHRMDY